IESPQYVSKDTGNPMRPTWEDEFGYYGGSIEGLTGPIADKPAEAPYGISTGVTYTEEGDIDFEELTEQGQFLIISQGVPMSRQEYEDAIKDLIQTGEPASIRNITISIDDDRLRLKMN